MSRLRVVQWTVQPVAMIDDGDELTPARIEPVSIPASEWEAWTSGGWRDDLAALTAQVEGPK